MARNLHYQKRHFRQPNNHWTPHFRHPNNHHYRNRHFRHLNTYLANFLRVALENSKSFTKYFEAEQTAAEAKIKYLDALCEPERTERYFKDPQNIKRDECARFSRFEGGCGKRDYGPKYCPKCAPGADAFTHTIAVVNSAIKKLCKVTHLARASKLAPSGTLYRA